MKENHPDQLESMIEKEVTKYDLEHSPAETFREPESAYLTETEIHDESIAGNKTLADYMALPEGARIEMIDGKFYEMSAPNSLHTLLGFELCSAFKNHVKQNGGNCIPFVAPTDVQLDCDDKTMVQPDVFIVCDPSRKLFPFVVGAPDLVVEIVSPSNRAIDVIKKRYKYQKAGVREYWMIFPEKKVVEVCSFENDTVKTYSFADQIPVGIWSGQCEIDFPEIYESLHFLLERQV